MVKCKNKYNTESKIVFASVFDCPPFFQTIFLHFTQSIFNFPCCRISCVNLLANAFKFKQKFIWLLIEIVLLDWHQKQHVLSYRWTQILTNTKWNCCKRNCWTDRRRNIFTKYNEWTNKQTNSVINSTVKYQLMQTENLDKWSRNSVEKKNSNNWVRLILLLHPSSISRKSA